MASAFRPASSTIVSGVLLALLGSAPFGCRQGGDGETTGSPSPTPEPAPRSPSREAVRELNVGLAYLEQHRFGQAEEHFRKSLADHPDYLEARINLAIALASAVKYGDAMTELDRALALDPKSPNAQYMKGLLHKYQGEKEPAVAAFEHVQAIDPNDTDTHYNLATIYKDRREFDKAIPLLERVIEASPHFVSAYYALGQAYLRNGQNDKGTEYLEKFQKLSGGVSAEAAGLRYGEQGRYALGIEDASCRAERPPRPFRYVDATAELGIAFVHTAKGLAGELGSGVLVHDLNGDALDDVLLLGGDGVSLFRADGTGKFTDATAAAGLGKLAGPAVGVAAGDVDRDGHVDLVVAGRFLIGGADGRFTDKTEARGLAKNDLVGSASLSFADLDHDGDLDLVATFPAARHLGVWINDGTGSLTNTKVPGFEGDHAALALTFADYDLDRDIDAVVAVDGGTPRLLANTRDLTFVDFTDRAGLTLAGAVRGISVADVDGDSWPDLFITNAGAPGHVLLRNTRDRKFAVAQRIAAGATASGCTFLDADLDGDIDLVIGEATGVRFLRNADGILSDETAAVGLDAVRADVRGLASGDLDGDGDLDLVLNVYGARALALRNDGAEKSSWLKVVAEGLSSNGSGFGTKLEARAACLHQKVETKGADGFLSQSSGTVVFGLYDEPQVDRLRMLWPGGVLQAEIDLPAKQTHHKQELDRKGSSCPFLWAWNGKEIEFISDFQGGSPLGLWVAPGVRNLPDHEEFYLLPADRIKPRDGAYDLRITESLEEIAYIDRVNLRVVDAPATVAVFPNERLLLMPPWSGYGLHFARAIKAPTAAVDAAGRDVRTALAKIDRAYAGALSRARFRGFAEPWSLELDFGPLTADERRGEVVLVAHGWVEFSNSTPMFAASQAGAGIAPPVLEILDDAGHVLTSLADAGAPAGLPKWMALPLTEAIAAIPTDGRVRVRYRTNMEVHFDYVGLALTDPATPHQVTDLEATEASLGTVGYPTRWSPDGRAPMLYQYSQLRPDETWQSQEGNYTRLGDVRELIQTADDLMVVMTHGDEIKLSFPTAALPPLAEGWKRHLILYSIGYAKDLDSHSAAPLTVGPMPFRSMDRYPYDGLGPLANPDYLAQLDDWNTRYVRPSASTLR